MLLHLPVSAENQRGVFAIFTLPHRAASLLPPYCEVVHIRVFDKNRKTVFTEEAGTPLLSLTNQE
jgi:hypothetical protein